jgi:uracil-DNA glycosylase family 4
MKSQLEAVAEELLRLKHAGVRSVVVREETLAALRSAVEARAGAVGVPSPGSLSAPAPRPSEIAPAPAVARGPAAETEPPGPPRSVLADRPPRRVVVAPVASAVPGELPSPPVFALPAGDKRTRWDWLQQHVTQHPVCRAHVRPGKKVVLGVGDLEAAIFFVGEAPGAEEEVQGEPFVGPAGQLLDRMIKAMGLERAQVYIGNIMNWRPQVPTPEGQEQVGNRPPTEQEMAFCLPFLRAQIEIVAPKLLVALGATAAKGLLGFDRVPTLGAVKGRWHEFAGIPLMVTYHPSYLLRANSLRTKRMAWEDFLQVMERAGLPISDRQRSFFL